MNATSVEEYLARIPRDDFRAELERVRRIIKAEIPAAEEVINYGMPGFKLRKVAVWFAAYKNHLSFFAGGGTEAFASSLSGYKVSKGTIQFTPDHPLPDDWVRQVVRARAVEVG